MNALTAAVFIIAVAYANAGAAIVAGPAGVVAAPGVGIVGTNARGALEGALGGHWIPDAAIPEAVVAPVGYAAAPFGLGDPIITPGVISRGALEGALGGQWIPDTLRR